jgi:hypothetical protein
VAAAGDARAEAGRRGARGRRPEERATAAASLGAPRGSCQRQEVALAELQWRPAAVLLRSRGGSRGRRKGGGALGADVKFQKFQVLDVKQDFLTVLYPKLENGQNKNCRTFQNLQLLFRVQIQKLKG